MIKTSAAQRTIIDVLPIEWWYQTYVNGVLIYEEYLYSTYECGSGGGGGGTGNTANQVCEQNAAIFINAGNSTRGPISETIVSQTASSQNIMYNWRIYNAYTWFIS